MWKMSDLRAIVHVQFSVCDTQTPVHYTQINVYCTWKIVAHFLQNVEFSFGTQTQLFCTFQGCKRWNSISFLNWLMIISILSRQEGDGILKSDFGIWDLKMCQNFCSGFQMKIQHFAKNRQKISVYSTQKSVYSTQKSVYNVQVFVYRTQKTHMNNFSKLSQG